METIRRKNDGWTTYQARKIAKVSIRRVNQVMQIYETTGLLPEIGKSVGRPAVPLQDWEIQLVKNTYPKYRVSASTLMRLIERDYDKHINHNRIHRIMLILGFAKKKEKRDVRKKDWIRYQRKHSLTAVHVDWYYNEDNQTWVFGAIDDASRKMLALLETGSPTTEASILGMAEASKHGKIRQCISDHGSQFISNIGGDSLFAAFLTSNSIKQILCRIKHPQSNGKIEKWFCIYKEHRNAFATKEEFLIWYNEIRPHRSLRFEELETPQMAFVRKMRPEV